MNNWSCFLVSHPEVFRARSVVGLFRKACGHDPDKIAVVTEEETCTYAQLERQSNQIARALEELGAGPGSTIAISSGRCVLTIAAILGIWKTGAAYVYFDSDSPKDYNDYIQSLCGAPLTIGIDFLRRAVAQREGGFFEERGEPDRLAVVIFTSGSTGYPKGVMLSHVSLVSSASNCCLELGICSDDHWGLFASFMFIAFVNDICTTLIAGATAHLIPKAIKKDIRKLSEYYIRDGITVTYLPPHMAMKYMDMPQPPSMRLLMVGSEPTRNLRKQAYDIVNVYASSEGSSIISYYMVKDARSEYPIGKIMPTYRYYIVDEEGRQAAPGEKGELWLSGRQLFCGYLKQDELTAKKLTSNPFSRDPGFETVFRTDDIVSEGPEGLVYHGRRDHMVKVRGFRIELNGVEQHILKFPGIREVCCTAFKDAGGTNILFAYYISGEKIDRGQLRAFLESEMPYYMVPSCLIQVDKFPLTPSGKVARKLFAPPPELNDRPKLLELYR